MRLSMLSHQQLGSQSGRQTGTPKACTHPPTCSSTSGATFPTNKFVVYGSPLSKDPRSPPGPSSRGGGRPCSFRVSRSSCSLQVRQADGGRQADRLREGLARCRRGQRRRQVEGWLAGWLAG